MFEHVGVELMGCQGSTVTNDNQFSSGSRESDVCSSGVRQKTDFPTVITSDHGDDDDFLFPPLKTVDGIDFQTDYIQLAPQQSSLRRVGGDDSNFLG